MFKLDKDNYFSDEANREYFSNSQYKSFRQCEAQQMAILHGEWEQEQSDAMLAGSYVHAWNEGKLEEFKEDNPKLFKRDGNLQAKFEICNKVIDVIQADSRFMATLAGQKEVVFTAEFAGTPWKILIDSYFPVAKRFGDLKVLKSLDDKFWHKELHTFENVFEAYGYYTQVAIYAEIERLASKRDTYFEPFIAVATKEKYPDKAIISFVSEKETYVEFIQRELQNVRNNMPRILAIKSGAESPIRCEKCDYCKSTKKLTGTVHYSHFIL